MSIACKLWISIISAGSICICMVTDGFKGPSMGCSLNIFFLSINRQKCQCWQVRTVFLKNINKASVQAWWVGLHPSIELYIDIV